MAGKIYLETAEHYLFHQPYDNAPNWEVFGKRDENDYSIYKFTIFNRYLGMSHHIILMMELKENRKRAKYVMVRVDSLE